MILDLQGRGNCEEPWPLVYWRDTTHKRLWCLECMYDWNWGHGVCVWMCHQMIDGWITSWMHPAATETCSIIQKLLYFLGVETLFLRQNTFHFNHLSVPIFISKNYEKFNIYKLSDKWLQMTSSKWMLKDLKQTAFYQTL